MRSTTTTVYYTLERDDGSWWDLAVPCTVTAGRPATFEDPPDDGEVEVLLDELTAEMGSTSEAPGLTADETAAITRHCLEQAPQVASDEHELDRADYQAGVLEDRRWGL